jgi:phytoene synthase
MAEDHDLDAEIRRADPDRWLASRFVGEPGARAGLIALYAFNHELARAAEVASQPLIGEMRLAWWREAIEEIFEGRAVRSHPTALALKAAVHERHLPRAGLEALVDARLRDLDAWPLKPDEAVHYIDATSGALMALAARSLSPGVDAHDVRHAARAWGLSGLSRLGRLPPDWSAEEVRARLDEAMAKARPEVKALPVRAFPAVAYATLARGYVAQKPMSELGKRLRLFSAVVRGRV